jgi:hypothetical protein
MLPRPSENSVRSRNLSDPHQFLEEGIYRQPSPIRGTQIPIHREQLRVYDNHEGYSDSEEMQEKTHIRQRSGYLSPTLRGNVPLGNGPDEAGTRQRKATARVDQGNFEPAEHEGKNGSVAGSGLGLALGASPPREKNGGQVVFEKPRKDSKVDYESQGLTGKDRKAFILLVMLCESVV